MITSSKPKTGGKYIRRKEEEPSCPRLVSRADPGRQVGLRVRAAECLRCRILAGRSVQICYLWSDPVSLSQKRKLAEKPKEAGAALSKSQPPLLPPAAQAPL